MSNCNSVFLVGNLTSDPVFKEISSTNQVVNFAIASNRNWTGPEGQEVEEVSFIDCVAFGKTAEIINTYFCQGRRIFVQGRLKQDRWKDKDTQKNMSRVRVIVENFHFMDNKKKEDSGDASTECVQSAAALDVSAGDDFDAL